jgi:hypothetical protein
MIGKEITALLKANSSLLALVPEGNIYPYVANEDTALPLLIYSIDSVNSEYTKDGWADDLIEFSVASYSEDYSSLQDIVSQVRLALEMKYITDSKRIIMTRFLEGFNITENVFVNKLTFRIEVY